MQVGPLGWVGELPLDPDGRWPAMGVRADDERWPRAASPEVLALRRRILAEHPEVVAQLPAGAGGCAEVASLVGVDDLAGAAVAQVDDLCVLAPEPGWPLVGGAVLFPSHWRLAEKLGRPLVEVHGRVTGFDGLAAKVSRFLDRLRPGQVAWRRNVLFHRDGELHSPWPSTAEVPVEAWWLRSERQTFRRLLATGAVLFTIATDTTPLASLAPDDRRRLAAWLRAQPSRWAPYAEVPVAELSAWLDQ